MASPQSAPDNHLGLWLRLDSNSPAYGQAVLDLRAIVAACRARWPERDVTETTAREALRAQGEYLQLVMSRAVLEPVLQATDQPSEKGTSESPLVIDEPITDEAVLRAVQQRDGIYRELASLRLLKQFEQPASAALGTKRPKLQVGDPRDGEPGREPTLLEYLAIALEFGDGRALREFVKWLQQQSAVGRKALDWNRMVRAVKILRGEIRHVARGRSAVDVWRELQQTPIATRLRIARVDEALFRRWFAGRKQPRLSSLGIAIHLVAKEYEVGAGSLYRMWRASALARKRKKT